MEDVIIIGGGQAGLAAGYQVQRQGLRFVILEAEREAVGSWPRYYDSLKLFSPARYAALPGLPFPGDPAAYPTREAVVAYLRAYAHHFQLPIHPHSTVERVERHADRFYVTTQQGKTYSARSVIAATGAFSRPHLPHFNGQADYIGQILHSAAYRQPQPFVGQRVLVIGAGNSAVQIATELAQVAQVTITSRWPLAFKPQRFLGRDLHFWLRVTGYDTWQRRFPQWSPLRLERPAVLDTGVYQAALRSGNPHWQPFFTGFTATGVQWADGTQQDFDSVVCATGFRPNWPYLQALGALDENGNARQAAGRSTTVDGLYYVGIAGQRSLASATLRGVGADAAAVVQDLQRYLRGAAQPQKPPCCQPHATKAQA